jgi:hypothetical protein
MVSLTLASPARADSDGEAGLAAIVLFGIGVIGGTVATIGTQVRIIEGAPDREWAIASYGLSGLNGAFAVAWFIAGAIEKDEPIFYGLGVLQLSLAVADLIPAIITTSVLPAADPGIPGQERRAPTAFPLVHLRGTF